MRVIWVVFLILILSINSAFAYELILPKDKKTVVDTNYAFLIGKVSNSEDLTINDEKVYTASNGAFAHSVKLKKGENRVVIRSNFNTQIYKIYKIEKEQSVPTNLVEFAPKLMKVKKDNTPLRSTPVDYGMNRISHLFKDTNIIVNGEKDSFYRVFLSQSDTAWIAKNAVENFGLRESTPEFINMDSKTFKNASVYTINFTNKLPYTIKENENEILFKVYNPQASENSVYTINVKKPKKYSYKTSLCRGEYTFKISELPFFDADDSLEQLTIAIDPGHGGSEKGAIGCLGHEEKDINLAIAYELKNILLSRGVNAIITRECDGNMSLDERVDFAQKNSADMFISIHLNSIGDIPINVHKNKGTSVYYYNENSKELAKRLQNSITKELGTRKDGVKQASFAVIRPTDYIGVLVEVAYMTNPVDSVLYTKDTFPKEAAESIANGVIDYITSEP